MTNTKFYLKFSFISFCILWTIYAFVYGGVAVNFVALLFAVSDISTFILSIVHLTKFKEKKLAILSLVLSAYVLLTLLVGFIVGLSVGMGVN